MSGGDIAAAIAAALSWSPWVSLSVGDMRLIPRGAGVYRVRVTGQDRLAYIGQTGRDLRGRLQELRSYARSGDMPFNDPHTAAPSLWAWRDAEGWEFECSAAPYGGDTRARLALETWLLWRHRLDHGVSTLCNHGRFHSAYSKSSDRKMARRGGRLETGSLNAAGGESSTPLSAHGDPTDPDWMGLPWTEWCELGAGAFDRAPGLYRLAPELGNGTLLYIGETSDLRGRTWRHAKTLWGGGRACVSYAPLPRATPKHVLHELENDLLGAYIEQVGQAPTYQFTNTARNARVSLLRVVT
jgi:hypothetical protein